MLSEKAHNTVKACRYCWMCRHLCPIGLKTGCESNTPRAKGLLLDFVEGGKSYSLEMAEDMFACCLCGACASGCETGFDPRIFIREARTKAIVEDVVPANLQVMIDSLLANGNMFGFPASAKAASLAGYAKDKAEVILYVGETAAFFTPQIVEAVAKLLKEAGDDFAVLKDEPQSGAELGDLIGYVEETVDCGRELADRIAKSDAKTVVVLDPNCAKVIKQEYPQWGCEVKAQVVTATSYLAQLVAGGKLKPSKLDLTGVTYHDSDRLARDLDETEPARTLFSAMGISVKEMFLNKQTTRSCGDAALKVHSPKIAALTAEGRWEDVERCGAKILVTACPACYTILGENVPKGYQLKDLFVLLAESCGL